MTALDLARIYQASQPTEFDAISTAASTRTVWPVVEGPSPLRVDEPSSLALALIGMATLAAYRGIQQRVTGSATPKRDDRGLIKPRRRAA